MTLGGTLPILTRALVDLGSVGLAVLLLLVDALVFFLMYRLARRYWIGLVFVPPVIYIVMISLLVVIVYLPMQSIGSLTR